MRRGRLATVSMLLSMVVIPACGTGTVGTGTPLAFSSAASYLALGDSVAYGWSSLASPTSASNYIGYPEALVSVRSYGVSNDYLANAACPGETSGSFLSETAPDNGCRALLAAGLPLHVSYTGTQMDYALEFLDAHPGTNLVTINIGANDLFLVQKSCAGSVACIATELPVTLNQFAGNLMDILGEIRSEYHGRVVVLTQYAFNYADPLQVQALTALAQETTVIGQVNGALIADGFGAFAAASAATGGDPCAAGLLIPLPGGGCDIHPSEKGRDLLAATIAQVLATND